MTDFYQGLRQELENTVLVAYIDKYSGSIIGQLRLNVEAALYGCGIKPTDDAPQIKNRLKWGTYGKHGDEPLRYVRLVDCSTDHLNAIMRNCKPGPYYSYIIGLILKDREP